MKSYNLALCDRFGANLLPAQKQIQHHAADDEAEAAAAAAFEGIDDMILTQTELSNLPETIEVFSHNRSFVGILYLRMYLGSRGRYACDCDTDTGRPFRVMGHTQLLEVDTYSSVPRHSRSGRATSCIQPEGETCKITPVEAEERAGLKNNKNWKKSLMTTYEVRCARLAWPETACFIPRHSCLLSI